MDSKVYFYKGMLAKQSHCLLLENFPDKNILFFSPLKLLRPRRLPAFSILVFIHFPFLDSFPPGLPRKRHPAPNLFSSKSMQSLVLQQLTDVFIQNILQSANYQAGPPRTINGLLPKPLPSLGDPDFGHKRNKSFPRPSFKCPAESGCNKVNKSSNRHKEKAFRIY